jgi:hypothetical protein
MTRVQGAPPVFEPIWQPPLPPAEPAIEDDPDAPAASTPLSDGADDSGVEPTAAGKAAPLQTSIARSELGAMHAIVHPASTAGTPVGGGGTALHVVSHPHVHVEAQSESSLHGPVCRATHVFHVTLVQVLPASQMGEMAGKPGATLASSNRFGGVGTALHGTMVTVR